MPVSTPAGPASREIAGDFVLDAGGGSWPIRNCTLILPNCLTFYCEDCKKRHFHGAGGKDLGRKMQAGELLGHWTAHCDDPRVWPHGYYLRLVEILENAPPKPKRRRAKGVA